MGSGFRLLDLGCRFSAPLRGLDGVKGGSDNYYLGSRDLGLGVGLGIRVASFGPILNPKPFRTPQGKQAKPRILARVTNVPIRKGPVICLVPVPNMFGTCTFP